MTDPQLPKDDWSEVEAVEKAFRDRDKGTTKAIILKAQALKILAIGASLALVLIGLSFLRPDIFPKIWAPSNTTIATKISGDAVAPKGDKLAPENSPSKSKSLDGQVTTNPREPESSPPPRQPPEPTEQLPKPKSDASNTDAPPRQPYPMPESQPTPMPEPNRLPETPPKPEQEPQQQATIVRDPEPIPSRHAPGSLAARLEQVIEGDKRTFTPKQFTQTEEFKTAEYHGALETIRDGKLIFRDGKVFEPLNTGYLITTSKYDGDYAYCRQSSPNENRYYCRVLHEGIEEKI